jgi:two-component system NarL family response regulator
MPTESDPRPSHEPGSSGSDRRCSGAQARLRARGYLLKHMLMTEVIAAIRAVCRGEYVIPPPVAANLARHPERDRLTPRELEVLGLMAQGKSNKEIAVAIGRTDETVKIHLKSVFAKLKVTTRTEAVRVALGRGLVHLD